MTTQSIIGTPSGYLDLQRLAPSTPPEENFSDLIKGVSPDFPSIFAQSNLARSLGLDDVAGPGYRKAFEFLIKDYAKSLKSTDDEKTRVERSYSAEVVKNHIEDERIRKVAQRALWLGNDETHYLRKWEDHDIDDLITLIRLTISWIELDLRSKQYESDLE